MHALPRWHRQGPRADGATPLGWAAAAGTVAGDDGRVDLRVGTGGAEPGAHRTEVLSAGSRVMHQENVALVEMTLVTFTLNGKTVVGRSDETILETAEHHGVEIPRLCYMEGMRADGNCRTCMVEIKGERVLAP